MQGALEEHKDNIQVIFFCKFEIKKVGFLPYYIKFGNQPRHLIKGFPLKGSYYQGVLYFSLLSICHHVPHRLAQYLAPVDVL